MALSFCSNWGSLAAHHLNPEMMMMSGFQQAQPELAEDLFFSTFDYNLALAADTTCIDPLLFDPSHSFYEDNNNYTNLLPYFSTPSDNSISFSPEMFPLDDLQFYQYPKRQRSYEDYYNSNFTPGSFDGIVPNLCLVPEVVAQLPEPAYACGSVESTVKKPEKLNLSAQSLAARERRRKITEKTRELGKLIPGGNKMNTAEMFQVASKYVKYLQAQVAVLQLMGSSQEVKEEPLMHTEELQVLLASPNIQEKLYLEEKCLVPKKFVQTLQANDEVQSRQLISKDIDQLLRTSS